MNNAKGILGYAKQKIANNPQVRNNPQFAQMIEAIEREDASQGQALANEILQRNGVTLEQALSVAFQKFNFPGM